MNVVAETGTGRHARPVLPRAPDKVCRALGLALAEGGDVHRCLAAQALGHIGGRQAVSPLIAALLDEDEDVRTDAAEALVQLNDPAAADQLLENLIGDPCTEVKLAAVRTLAKLQDRRVIPWLRRMIRGRDEEIAWDEEEFYSSGWDDWVEIQVAAVEAAAEMNAIEALPDILEAMRDENAQDMTEAAFKALACLGKPGIDALAGFLAKTQPTRIRRRAATVLARASAENAAGPLAVAFADTSPEVRTAALRARAAQFPDDPDLQMMLTDSDAGVRTCAVQLLGGDIPALLPTMLDDPSATVQAAALTALADATEFAADDPLIGTIRSRLSDDTTAVVCAAATTLAALAPEIAAEVLTALLGDTSQPVEARLAALQGLAAIGGEQATDVLIGVIDDEARPIRLQTMTSLADLARRDAHWPNSAALALLSALNGDHDPEPDEDAEQAPETETPPEPNAPETAPPKAATDSFPTSTLTSIVEDAPIVGKLAGLPEQGIELSATDMERLALAKNTLSKKRMVVAPDVDRHADIRSFAARVLGDLEHGEIDRALASALGGTDADVQIAAADSLARVGAAGHAFHTDIVDVLVAAMPEASRDMKLLLIRALAACDRSDVTGLLVAELAASDSFLRAEAVSSLGRLGLAGAEIEAMLADPDPSVRLRAAEAIAGAANANAVRLLTDFTFSFNGYHKREAASLLRDLDAEAANTAFTGTLGDPEQKQLWSIAIEALDELNRITNSELNVG